jgi:hypothetical protein
VNCNGCWARRHWRTENEILREALDLAQPKKPAVALALAGAGRHAVKTIADALGVAALKPRDV